MRIPDSNSSFFQPAPQSGLPLYEPPTNKELISDLYSDDDGISTWAAIELGNKGEEVLPLLEDVFKNNQYLENEPARYSAVYTLSQLGKKAFPLLVYSCTDVSQDVVHEAVKVLKEKSSESVDYLIDCLKKNDRTLLSGALFAVGEISKEAKNAIPQILICLQDRDSLIRAKACEALGKIQEGSEIVVPALKQMLNDPDWLVVDCAKDALLKLPKVEEPVIGEYI